MFVLKGISSLFFAALPLAGRWLVEGGDCGFGRFPVLLSHLRTKRRLAGHANSEQLAGDTASPIYVFERFGIFSKFALIVSRDEALTPLELISKSSANAAQTVVSRMRADLQIALRGAVRTLESALRYLSLGFHILPLAKGDKVPVAGYRG